MFAYRLYCLDGTGKIDLADWIEAADDEQAIAKARTMKNGATKCEIWQDQRLVTTLRTADLAD